MEVLLERQMLRRVSATTKEVANPCLWAVEFGRAVTGAEHRDQSGGLQRPSLVDMTTIRNIRPVLPFAAV